MVGMKCRERIGRIYCEANIGSSNSVLFMEQSSVSKVCSVKGMKTELSMRLHIKFAQKLGRFRIRSFTVRESNPGRSLYLLMLASYLSKLRRYLNLHENTYLSSTLNV